MNRDLLITRSSAGAVFFIALLSPPLTFAQTSSPSPKSISDRAPDSVLEEVIDQKFYTYVEQMPKLPGGGGNKAIVNAIQSKLIYPPSALRQKIQGRVFVSFTVGGNGAVYNAKIVKGLGGGCDKAVLAAVRELPRFIPGTQMGKPVAVTFTVPIVFQIENTVTAPDTLQQVYTLVNQMPHLPSSANSTAIARAIQQAVVMPAEVSNDSSARKVFVGFTVGPSGVIRDVSITRSLNASCDAAALAAVQKLPRFVGGQLNGKPVSVRLTVPVLFGRLPQHP